MTKYDSTVAYLFSLLPMYQRIGKTAFKKDLTNIKKLCLALGNPHKRIKTVHIAGTNGKGTVSHIMAYGLQQSGYKVGLYSSPHYKDFRERVKINGQLVSKKYVVDFVKRIDPIIHNVQPSFFEITVAMAFDYFAQKEVDIAIIEVGLGGRLDSTNILTPQLSVITNISFDHMSMLGNTLPEIAKEKAGIIKQGIPVLIGETQEDVKEVFTKKAKSLKAPISFADQLWNFDEKGESKFLMQRGSKKINVTRFPLKGDFQHKNLRTAVASLTLLADSYDINWISIEENFDRLSQETHYLGRWQYIGNKPDVLVDSAHNEAGLSYLNKYFKNQSTYSNIHCVIGFANDKDLSSILKSFPKNATYYFVKANVPRGLDANILRDNGSSFGLNGKAYSSVRRGLAAARKKANSSDLIFVGGSIFVVAEVL